MKETKNKAGEPQEATNSGTTSAAGAEFELSQTCQEVNAKSEVLASTAAITAAESRGQTDLVSAAVELPGDQAMDVTSVYITILFDSFVCTSSRN